MESTSSATSTPAAPLPAVAPGPERAQWQRLRFERLERLGRRVFRARLWEELLEQLRATLAPFELHEYLSRERVPRCVVCWMDRGRRTVAREAGPSGYVKRGASPGMGEHVIYTCPEMACSKLWRRARREEERAREEVQGVRRTGRGRPRKERAA